MKLAAKWPSAFWQQSDHRRLHTPFHAATQAGYWGTEGQVECA